MKCVGLLVFVVLIQSVNKFIKLNRHELYVEEKNYEFDDVASAGDETPITVENGYKHEDDISSSIVTPSDNSGRGQDEVISDGFESCQFYDQHSDKVFPRICMDGLTEFMTDIVEGFVTLFSNLHSSLSRSTRCESVSISAASTVLFTIVDALAKATGSTSSVLSFLGAVLPEAFHSIAEIVSGLNIRTFATQLSGAISDLEKLLTSTIEIVMNAVKLKIDILKMLNAATLLVAKSVQVMVNTLNFIAEATTKAVGSVTTEEQEAVISLSLILGTVTVIVQSVFASIACVLSSIQISSATLNKVLVVIDSTLESIIGVITSITKSVPGSLSVVIGVISMTFTQLTNSLSSSLETIQSSVESVVANSLEDLLNRMSESVGDIASSISDSVASIKSSLNIVSASSFAILSKVANQLNQIFKGLSEVNGTDNVIVTTLVNSFPSIFNSFKSASNSLVSGLGVEASEALNRYTENVQLSLKSLLSLISGSTTENVKIGEVVGDICKSVQYVAATVISITTVSEAIADLSLAVAEAVLSLPFILSAILYVTQWVLSVAVSIFASIAGSVSEILSKFTILIAHTLEIVTKICSTISNSASVSLVDTFNSIVPYSENLSQLVASSFRDISGVIVNIVFNIDEILTGIAKQHKKPIAAGVLHDTEGCVLRILAGLTGTLSSISPSLSSTLSSLNNSLKIASDSDSLALKAISSVLLLLLGQVTTITGSASEILSLISNVLATFFGHITTVVSQFKVLGDASVSLNASVSNIHNGLRSLIDTINDSSSKDLSILNEPIKNCAKTVQVLISTFAAIVDAAVRANEDVVKSLSDVIHCLPFVVSTIILVVQYVIGAAVAKVLVTFGSIPANLQQLALAMSTILQNLTSVTANTFVSKSDVNFTSVLRKISSSVSDLNNLASTSLSVISGVLANVKVSMGASEDAIE